MLNQGLSSSYENFGRGWVQAVSADDPVGREFAGLVTRMRELQDAVASTRPNVEQSRQARVAIEEAIAALGSAVVPEESQLSGRLLSLPGHGQALVPPVLVDSVDVSQIEGRVTLSRFYLGANGAAHGGVIPLVFDEILGFLAATDAPKRRTAYLHVDYRSVTPIDTELSIRAWLVRQEGRKQFIKGTLHHGGTLCAEAEGLFVELRPGQP